MDKIWEIWNESMRNSKTISKIQKKVVKRQGKYKLNSEMIWKIRKKGKLNNEMIWKIWKKLVKRYEKHDRNPS